MSRENDIKICAAVGDEEISALSHWEAARRANVNYRTYCRAVSRLTGIQLLKKYAWHAGGFYPRRNPKHSVFNFWPHPKLACDSRPLSKSDARFQYKITEERYGSTCSLAYFTELGLAAAFMGSRMRSLRSTDTLHIEVCLWFDGKKGKRSIPKYRLVGRRTAQDAATANRRERK